MPIFEKQYTIHQAALAIGVRAQDQTVRTWIHRLGIPVQTIARGWYVVGQASLEALAQYAQRLAQRSHPGIPQELLQQAVVSVNGRVPTLQEIGGRFGVTRERIRQLLKRYGITKANLHARLPITCRECGRVLSTPYWKSKGICRSCALGERWTNQRVSYQCKQCGATRFTSKRLYEEVERRAGHPPVFCNRRCHGRWIATHYGFSVHPENIHLGHRGRRYAGEGSLYARKKAAGICITCTQKAVEGQVRCLYHREKYNREAAARYQRLHPNVALATTDRRHRRKPDARRGPHAKDFPVTCSICGISFLGNKANILANEKRHKSTQHYCPKCYPMRIHRYRQPYRRAKRSLRQLSR